MRVDRSLLSWMPLLVGAVSIGITVWLWRHEQVTMQRALVAEFDASLRQTASRIDQRMASYEQMLRGVQKRIALFQKREPYREFSSNRLLYAP